jgi:hypothetical protein
MILRLLYPRDHHEWMTLQERPEADERHPHPEVNSLPGFDVKWLLKLDTDLDRVISLGNMGPRASITKDIVSADDHIALSNVHEQK